MQPRAIETRYKGYRFRSRLEARWAVFFDALGLAWEYEPEGFELPGGVRYLPDFWLPELRCYVEVKPNIVEFDELKKPWLLARGKSVFVTVLIGTPDAGYNGDNQEFVGDYPRAYGPFAAFGEHTGEPWRSQDHTCFDGSVNWFDSLNPHQGPWVGIRKYTNKEWRLLEKATAAARGARFEHGESGARK